MKKRARSVPAKSLAIATNNTSTDSGFFELKRAGFMKDPAFPLAVIRYGDQPPVPMHTHNFSELVIVTGGHGVHKTLAGDYPMTPGNVFVAPSDSPHGFHDVEDLSIICILYCMQILLEPRPLDLEAIPGFTPLFILEPMVRDRGRFKACLNLTAGELANIVTLAEDLKAEIAQQKPGWRFCSQAIFMVILGWLARHYTESPPDRGKHLMLLGKALGYIDNNLTEKITVDDLAQVANMSRSAFYQHFSAATGCSPLEYIVNLRLTLAAQLIRDTNKSITEIAYETGFTHLSYFARKFRDVMKASPSQYRTHHHV